MPCPREDKCEGSCEWGINSLPHNNCFWEFVRDKSDIDGAMDCSTQSEIGTLLRFKQTQVPGYLKKARGDFEEALGENSVKLLLEDIETSGLEEIPLKRS